LADKHVALTGALLLCAIYLPALAVAVLTTGGSPSAAARSELFAAEPSGALLWRPQTAPRQPNTPIVPTAEPPTWTEAIPPAQPAPASAAPQTPPEPPPPAPEPQPTLEHPGPPQPQESILVKNQAVVFYGSPLHSGLGILGMFEPDEAALRVRAQAAIYDAINGDRGVAPVLDIIYALAQAEPTDNGLYLRYLEDHVVERYIRLAEEHDLQLILDLQIGRGNIAEEVRKAEPFLTHPRVHVAIDPEYAVGPHGEPIITPGRISGHELNEVQHYLQGLIESHALPSKLLVMHQYIEDTVVDGEATVTVPHVDLVLNMDAFGEADAKRDKYHYFATMPYARRNSFNIFLKQDERVLSEHEVLELRPLPDVVFYQ
jgi:hypothetical protein